MGIPGNLVWLVLTLTLAQVFDPVRRNVHARRSSPPIKGEGLKQALMDSPLQTPVISLVFIS